MYNFDLAIILTIFVWISAAANGQSSMTRGPQTASCLQIRLEGDASEALPAPMQPPQSVPAAGPQPLAVPLAIFTDEDQKPESAEDKPDVDMEEI